MSGRNPRLPPGVTVISFSPLDIRLLFDWRPNTRLPHPMKTPEQTAQPETAGIDRRAFVKTAALAGAGLALGPAITRAFAAKNKDKSQKPASARASGAAAAGGNRDLENYNPAADAIGPFGAAPAGAPNILMIAIDDLRAWANYLGHPQVKTPNLDRLAAMGVAFTHSYCISPLCNPSRTALLTGLRPSTTGVYDNNVDWRKCRAANRVPTIPLWLRKHGYTAHASGKIYHDSFRRASDWDEYNPDKNFKNLPSDVRDKGVKQIVFRPVSVGDSAMTDHKTVDWCIERLQRKYDKPLLLGCGFHKPHLAWEVPQKYFDMYPLDKIELPKVQPSLDGLAPTGRKWADKDGIHAAMLKSGRWKEAVQAYLACITFTDTQIGRLLDALERSAYKDNTIIVLWCDHGWHHGEKHHWRKSTLWEEATHTHLIYVAPGVTKPGGVCERAVDNSAIYPTLCELAGVPIPAHVEGKSIRALLANPAGAVPERPAVSTFEQNNHAVRTDKWRYIRYADGGEELYDHDADPLEWTNLAKDPKHAAVKEDLKKWFPKTNVPIDTSAFEEKAKNGKDGEDE